MYLRAMRSDWDHESLLLGSNFYVNSRHLSRITLQTQQLNSHTTTGNSGPCLTTCGAYCHEAQATISGTGVSLTEHTVNPSRILIKEVATIWGVRHSSTASAGEPWLRGTTLDWWDASCWDSAWQVRTRSFSCYFKPSQEELLWLCFLGIKNH